MARKSKIKKEIEVVLGDIRDFDSVLNASKGCDNIAFSCINDIPYSYISPLAISRPILRAHIISLNAVKMDLLKIQL